MWVSGALPVLGAPQRLPSMRSPVPQSRMICNPAGFTSGRQGVFPPYRHVPGSTVGVDPRTPQKLNLAMASLIYLNRTTLVHAAISRNQIQRKNYVNIQVLPLGCSHRGSHWPDRQSIRTARCQTANKPPNSLRLKVTLPLCSSKAFCALLSATRVE